MAIDCAGYADFATIIYNIFGYNTYPIKIPDHTATMVKVGNKLVVLDINYINKLTDLREWIKEVEKTPWVGCGNNVSSMFNLGILLKKLKRYEEAAIFLKKAQQINPKFKSTELCKDIEELDKEIRERGGPLAIYTEKTTMTI